MKLACPGRPYSMDWKLELVAVPVSDQDRAKDFYVGKLGWILIVDHRAGDDFRVIQVLPPGSACAIALMRNPDAAGSVHGLHLVVSDIAAAHAELADHGVAVTGLYHFEAGAQRPGPDPERGDYNTFFTFNDPDGIGWMVQEVRRAPAGG
jgi:catechol 2,3-dioxygenase-like lactoylglutathione lyase family enzyme